MDVVGSPRRGQFPSSVGRYELLLPIGKGGTATVYLARTRGVRGFEHEVALKLSRSDGLDDADADAAFNLVEEAKLASRIRHLNVVSVLDVGDDLDGVYLVMDYIEGDSLRALMNGAAAEGQRVPGPVAVRILADALAGLHAAHELRDDAGTSLNLVHRDVSPHNILVGIDGITRLSDFGVAKVQSREGGTRTGIVKGKVRYMSPEQAMGKALDRRADVWAAGVVAWELLAGRRLYEGTEDVATAMLIVNRDPPPLRDVAPDIPAGLSDVIAAALVRARDARLPTADALRRRLLEAAAPWTSESTDVQRYVEAAVGGKLQERRRQIEAIVRARAGGPSADLGAVTSVDATETRAAPMAFSASRPWRRHLAIIGPTMAAIGLALVIGVRERRTGSPERAASPAVSAEPSAAVAESATPEAPASAPAVASAPSAPPVLRADGLRVTANVPLRRIEINGRPLAVVPPSVSVALNLTASESASIPTILATAVDGRRARGIARGGVVEIRFDPSSRATGSPHAHPAATGSSPTAATQPPPMLPDTLRGP